MWKHWYSQVVEFKLSLDVTECIWKSNIRIDNRTWISDHGWFWFVYQTICSIVIWLTKQ